MSKESIEKKLPQAIRSVRRYSGTDPLVISTGGKLLEPSEFQEHGTRLVDDVIRVLCIEPEVVTLINGIDTKAPDWQFVADATKNHQTVMKKLGIPVKTGEWTTMLKDENKESEIEAIRKQVRNFLVAGGPMFHRPVYACVSLLLHQTDPLPPAPEQDLTSRLQGINGAREFLQGTTTALREGYKDPQVPEYHGLTGRVREIWDGWVNSSGPSAEDQGRYYAFTPEAFEAMSGNTVLGALISKLIACRGAALYFERTALVAEIELKGLKANAFDGVTTDAQHLEATATRQVDPRSGIIVQSSGSRGRDRKQGFKTYSLQQISEDTGNRLDETRRQLDHFQFATLRPGQSFSASDLRQLIDQLAAQRLQSLKVESDLGYVSQAGWQISQRARAIDFDLRIQQEGIRTTRKFGDIIRRETDDALTTVMSVAGIITLKCTAAEEARLAAIEAIRSRNLTDDIKGLTGAADQYIAGILDNSLE